MHQHPRGERDTIHPGKKETAWTKKKSTQKFLHRYENLRPQEGEKGGALEHLNR